MAKLELWDHMTWAHNQSPYQLFSITLYHLKPDRFITLIKTQISNL